MKYFVLTVAVIIIIAIIRVFWLHRKDIRHDFRAMINAESPQKCRWVGSFLLLITGIVVCFSAIGGALYYLITGLVSLICRG